MAVNSEDVISELQKKLKTLEAQLKESDRRFRILTDNITQLTWMANPEGEIFWYNKRWYEYSGVTLEELKGEGLKKIFHPDCVEKIFSSLKEALKTGTPWECTFPIQSRDGGYRWFLTRAIPVRDDRGVIIEWFGTCTDVTDIKRIQEELQFAAERFRRFLSVNIVGIAITEAQGNVSYVNDYCIKISGYEREEFESNKITWIKMTPPEYLELDYNAIEELRVKGYASPYEKQLIKKDGSRIWVVNFVAMLAGPGEQHFVLFLDITDKKRALEEAQERSEEVETILNSIPDGLVILNSDASIIKINSIASDLLCIPQNETKLRYDILINTLRPKSPDGKLLEVEDLPSYRALHGEVVRNSVIISERGDHVRWVSESASPITNDGRVVGAILEFSDITILHELQQQLAGERNFIDTVLRVSGALIVVIDNDGRIVRFNRACEEMTGYNEKEILNRSIYRFIPSEEHEGIRNVVLRLSRGETPIEHEHFWFTRGGEKRYILWRNTALFNEQGKVDYIVSTGIDITDRKHLEEELNKRAGELSAANTDLESFSYSVSHDLRSPLAVINGLSSIMIEDYANSLDKEGREYLQKINDGAKKMMHLIEDMLDLSRVGRYEMKKEEINLSEMISKYLDEFRSGSPQRKVELKVKKDVRVYADPRLIHLAIENLLRNAWKFTSKKPVTVIEFGTIDLEGKVTCYIKDNGVGFDQKFGEVIFEPFKRAPGEKEFGGTGIGLSIVKRVMDRHGGKVWAEGEPGKGAVFYFTLS